MPFPAAAPVAATGWTGVPASFSPAMETHMRVLDFGVDKYGLNAYIYDSTNDGTTNYDRVLFSRTKSGADAVGNLRKGEWADVKVTISGGPLDGPDRRLARQGRGAHRPTSRSPPVPHVASAARSRRGRRGRASPVSPATSPSSSRRSSRPRPRPTSQSSKPGIVSEETYVEQGLYWATAHHPMLEYVVEPYQPDLLLVGHADNGRVPAPVPRPRLADPARRRTEPRVRRRPPQRRPDGRVAEREAFIRTAYEEADDTSDTRAERSMGKKTTTFVASDHGFAPQFLAIDASKPLVELGLLSRPQTGNCRPAAGETIGKAKACWAGGTLQIYLNVAGPRPGRRRLRRRSRPANVDAKVAEIKAKYLASRTRTTGPHDGVAEGWNMIDRIFTKAEARFIPNGPGTTADMAYPTRTGDLVVFSYPPYQFDAETPGTLVAPSHFFGQHGYVPDVQDLADQHQHAGDVPGRRRRSPRARSTARTIDLAPTLAYLIRIPEPQHSQGRVCSNSPRAGTRTSHLDRRPERLPRSAPADDATFDGSTIPSAAAAFLATMFDEKLASLPGRR